MPLTGEGEYIRVSGRRSQAGERSVRRQGRNQAPIDQARFACRSSCLVGCLAAHTSAATGVDRF